ncbi:MAG: hypothetical protein H0W36_14615, partial [Gemmatimonadetes bacterium]|nr:hypothetical protein [Gemmatimonadota bacterium]
MKLREIFRYEVGYRLHSPSTWVYAGFLVLVAFWMFLATADEGASALANAPERLAGGSVLPGMFGMLVTAALFGDAAVRDIRFGMDPLVYTVPLGKAEHLGGRFLGALAVNAIVLLAIPLGVFVATWFGRSFEAMGPFRLAAHVQPFFVFLLPNLVVVGAILFAIGMLARRVLPVYLGAIGIFIGYIVALNYAGGIESPMLASLVDPLGLVSLQ